MASMDDDFKAPQVWPRSAARAIDYLIYLGVVAFVRDSGLATVYRHQTLLQREGGWSVVMLSVAALAWLALLPVPVAVYGTPLGKRAFGIRVRHVHGMNPPSFARALARETVMVPLFFLPTMLGAMALSLLRDLGPCWSVLVVLAVAAVILGLVSWLWQRYKRKRGIFPHDRLGNTVVIQVSRPSLPWLLFVIPLALLGLLVSR